MMPLGRDRHLLAKVRRALDGVRADPGETAARYALVRPPHRLRALGLAVALITVTLFAGATASTGSIDPGRWVRQLTPLQAPHRPEPIPPQLGPASPSPAAVATPSPEEPSAAEHESPVPSGYGDHESPEPSSGTSQASPSPEPTDR